MSDQITENLFTIENTKTPRPTKDKSTPIIIKKNEEIVVVETPSVSVVMETPSISVVVETPVVDTTEPVVSSIVETPLPIKHEVKENIISKLINNDNVFSNKQVSITVEESRFRVRYQPSPCKYKIFHAVVAVIKDMKGDVVKKFTVHKSGSLTFDMPMPFNEPQDYMLHLAVQYTDYEEICSTICEPLKFKA